ncbi:LRAT domain [Dillenia turbinata]|uniref:LRAT domain n=1 Tax=Dillenia turbinata TaxID=194707 RepID=A0AAN8ZJF7_9MAGN
MLIIIVMSPSYLRLGWFLAPLVVMTESAKLRPLNLEPCFDSRDHGVVKSCLECFLSGHKLCRVVYEVSSRQLLLKRAGSCSTENSDDAKISKKTNNGEDVSYDFITMIRKVLRIYVREGEVIHYTKTNESRPSFNVKGNCVCGFDPNKDHGVVKSCLECFLSGHKLYRVEYGVSSRRLLLMRAGTCSKENSDDAMMVLHRAETLLIENSFGEYNLLFNNCESFARFCMTGKAISKQVVAAVSVDKNKLWWEENKETREEDDDNENDNRNEHDNKDNYRDSEEE